MGESWLLMQRKRWCDPPETRYSIGCLTGDSILFRAIAERRIEVKRRGRVVPSALASRALINSQRQGFAKPCEVGISWRHGRKPG
jgi:hypothetical protein